MQAVSDALASPGAAALSTINLATALSRLAKALGRAQQDVAEGRGVRAEGEHVAGAVWGEALERLRVAPRDFEARQIATLFWSLSRYRGTSLTRNTHPHRITTGPSA